MNTWQLQDAKNKFSQVVEEAMTNGPQMVTKRGVESVVVLSKEEYLELSKKKPLIDVLCSAPKGDYNFSRDTDEEIRDIDL